MDEVGIETAVLSAPDADLLYRDRAIALRVSRLLNELFAQVATDRPGRFGGFASLPMPHLDDTLREMAYALDVLKLDGVMLSTSYDGCYLGDARIDPLLHELDRRHCVVFVHPVSPMGMQQMALDFPASLLEYAFDTTRCITNLIRFDSPLRFPNIKFIFSHAGGAAPYLLSRLSLLDSFLVPGHVLQVEEDRAKIARGIRHFYYDTALSANDLVLTALKQIVGYEHVVFGSDYPQVPTNFIRASVGAIVESSMVDIVERDHIAFNTGLALLPRLRRGR